MDKESQDEQESVGFPPPPDRFLAQVKDALDHALDLRHLQKHALAQELGLTAGVSDELIGQRLRQSLIAAIETLLPERNVSLRSPSARSYHLLRLHYLQSQTVDAAAREIGLSSRQAYRDLREGEKAIADILWAKTKDAGISDDNSVEVSSFQAEIARLGSRTTSTDIILLLKRAKQAVDHLAQERGVCVQLNVPGHPLVISVDPMLARQVLIGLMSHAIQQSHDGSLKVMLESQAEEIKITFGYPLREELVGSPTVRVTTLQLADLLAWKVRNEQEGNERIVSVSIGQHRATVLIIDDNAGLVKLLRRYLSDRPCQVLDAPDGKAGLRMAQHSAPDVIILDVMIPEIDGWELLQRLRNHPTTADIPVIICSVVNDPTLAYSLGASIVLQKPVARRAILEALAQLRLI